ncbi:FAD-dependent monooxygenase [Microcella daejeonensis]|uniref:FAD-dependent monooxygenase n=1 Tax=Microcella daejeonensis TaxID=2994971 RepID=UPI0022711EC8|nr:FAD-dependent monooxygenase [Microcella daejeonensis]WAB84545.1 FAD-dependent monooxygenase [Microcella daejeonensis]
MTVRVAIVGGGPVGLATAIGARLAGLSPVIFEARSGPIDKACGEGLMPGAMAALRRLGVDPAGSPIRGIRYQDARRAVEHRYGPGREGRGVRRLVLHAALLERASELGVARRTVRVDGFSADASGVVVDGERFDALVGADGLHSRVRAVAGLDRGPARAAWRGSSAGRAEAAARPAPAAAAAARERALGADGRRFGLRQHFAVAPWSDLVEVTYLDEVELYVTPVDEGTVGVAVLGRRPLDLGAAIARVPSLAERLSGAAPASELRAAGALRQRTRARTAGRVALVGDASGYVDALTGEGLRVGLAQSEQLVAALAAGTLPAYERAWSRSTRDFRMLTAGLLAAATSPARGLIVPAAAAMPRVFGAVVDRLAR